jgi:hypothetical protein
MHSIDMRSSIQISTETKELISSFGSSNETYEDVIKRLYDLAVKQQLRELLLDESDTLSVDEARRYLDA